MEISLTELGPVFNEATQPYTNSTAAFNWVGLLYRYAAVVLMLRCPASVFKMCIAVPLFARFVKNVLRPL